MSLLIRIFSFAFIFAAAVVNADKRPANIILIMADDLGYETINCNGGTSWETPNIDKLAENGVRFDHCYSQPLCTPSRVKIMTGIYNVRNYVNFGVLDRKVTTFGHLFKKAGYATAICGKWQLGKEKDAPQHFGFDESCLWQHWRSGRKKGRIDGRYENPILEINGRERDFNNGEFGSDVVNKFACDFISKNKEKPFFLYYPMILTHCPFVATPDSADYDPKSPGSKS
ncbi:MAG: sulfatase-like hydrolase/transferase [Lentisphaeraceae bacterium]|nr:sulfatase-like hydrolase/transferase [Lentisphaeraceae bacterium]